MTPKIAELKLIEKLFKGSTREIIICSPWISIEGVSILRSCLGRIRADTVEVLRVWCRISLEDHLQGRTDYSGLLRMLWAFKGQHRGVRLDLATAENLHAKVYCVDGKSILGSANLTKGGFCGGNLEIIALGSASETARVKQELKELEKRLQPMTLSRFKKFCRQVERIPVQKFQAEYAGLVNKYKPAKMPHYEMRFR